jgi:hypothetical protein
MRVALAGLLSLSLAAPFAAAAQVPFSQALDDTVPKPGPALDAYVRNMAMAALIGGRTSAPEATDRSPEADEDDVLPDKVRTPGLIAQRSAEKVCTAGYSASVRHYDPAASARLFSAYGVEGSHEAYEDDHLVPIKLGGDPTDPRNQWPQPRYTARWNAALKDRLEWRLITWVCDGSREGADARLEQAQSDIMSDWIAAYAKYCPADTDCPGYGKD